MIIEAWKILWFILIFKPIELIMYWIREMPEVTNVPKGEEQDNAEQKQLVPEEVPEEKNPKEEDNVW